MDSLAYMGSRSRRRWDWSSRTSLEPTLRGVRVRVFRVSDLGFKGFRVFGFRDSYAGRRGR
jgi:hypothetical protein